MFQIRPMIYADKSAVLDMMQTFYASPAVLTNGSAEIFANDVDTCLSDSPFLEGYVFEQEGIIAGYGMLAKSYSTEYGRPCIWIEDIYFMPEYTGKGGGSQFLQFVKEKYAEAIIRLEVEEENIRAMHAYKKAGFDVMPYTEMKYLPK